MNQHPEAEQRLRELAYKLGTQVGMAIMDSGESGTSPRDVAKSGRKYIIDLDKSRTYDDFLEAIKRIQLRYATLRQQGATSGAARRHEFPHGQTTSHHRRTQRAQ